MSEEDQQSTALIIPEDATVKIVPADQLPDLDSMEEGMSLAPQYREFKEGESVRAVFCGFSEMQSQNRDDQQQGKVIPMGIFQSNDGVWVNAGSNLVQQVKNVPIGTPLQVTFKGKEKTKGGFYVNTFEVRLLKLAEPGQERKRPTGTFDSASAQSSQQQNQAASPTGDKADQALVVQVMRKAAEKSSNALEFANNVLERKITKLADMTTKEANSVLSYLEQL